MATRKGFEPSTSGVTGRHSNQLNYRTNAGCFVRSGCKYMKIFILCKDFLKEFSRTALSFSYPHLLYLKSVP